ncbi:MAG: hypothetical protein HQL07_15870 [Nitrospirae bacterium]|nr:hypothetical protein [Magnetococcales bacterium]
MGWNVTIMDLSDTYYSSCSTFPARFEIISATVDNDFTALDDLYFKWEDELKNIGSGPAGERFAGLLSGFFYDNLRKLPLTDIARFMEEGGYLHDRFQERIILPSLKNSVPDVIGITIISHHQILPALELLIGLRRTFPDTLVVLGGNVVTRLKYSPAFAVLQQFADHLVLFQGESSFRQILQLVELYGVEKARHLLPSTSGDELIPPEIWPVPDFTGINWNQYAGVPTLPFVSTRGCYWGQCHFCSIPAGWAKNGYGGSATGEQTANQIAQMVGATGIPRIKFVDEAFPPAKVKTLAQNLVASSIPVEWEAYARIEPAWEDPSLLETAFRSGLRKLYFGLEQAPGPRRSLLNKNDKGDIRRLLDTCHKIGIRVHLFCMVGFPGTTREDALDTTRFLIEQQDRIDTADMVGFNLDRLSTIPGVRPIPSSGDDWRLTFPFEATQPGVMNESETMKLEYTCQEMLWDAVPRLLHPLYRLVGQWSNL